MSAPDVSEQLVEKIPLVGNAPGSKVPEVVMGIADWKLRFQGGFLGQREPVIIPERHVRASDKVFDGPIISQRHR
jgi:hypothetical protein